MNPSQEPSHEKRAEKSFRSTFNIALFVSTDNWKVLKENTWFWGPKGYKLYWRSSGETIKTFPVQYLRSLDSFMGGIEGSACGMCQAKGFMTWPTPRYLP